MDALPQSVRMKCAETARFSLVEKTTEIEPSLATRCKYKLQYTSVEQWSARVTVTH